MRTWNEKAPWHYNTIFMNLFGDGGRRTWRTRDFSSFWNFILWTKHGTAQKKGPLPAGGRFSPDLACIIDPIVKYVFLFKNAKQMEMLEVIWRWIKISRCGSGWKQSSLFHFYLFSWTRIEIYSELWAVSIRRNVLHVCSENWFNWVLHIFQIRFWMFVFKIPFVLCGSVYSFCFCYCKIYR